MAAIVAAVCLNEIVTRPMGAINRRLRDNLNPFDVPEETFRLMFRFSKAGAMEFVESVIPHMPATSRQTAIPPYLRVLCCLNFMACGSYQRRIGQDYFHAMSQTSVCTSIKVVVSILNRVLVHQWIKFPRHPQEIQRNKERFMMATHFPGVVAAIDGTHVAIVPPLRQREHMYVNRKGYHSINVQVVCDIDLRVLSLNARHGGRPHDSYVWRHSALRMELERRYEAGDHSTWMLADRGYPLEPWMMVIIPNALPDSPEARFNETHMAGRNCAERAIGVMKGWLRCLRRDRVLHYSPEVAGRIINACACVHNMLIHQRVPLPEMHFDDIDNLQQDAIPVHGALPANPFQAVTEIRNRIVRQHFQ